MSEDLRSLEEKVKDLRPYLDDRKVKKIALELFRIYKRQIPKDALEKTADGSYTLWSETFKEPYHSVSAGAVRECRLKFLYPSGLLTKAVRSDSLSILDVGFGLGYNVAVAITLLKAVNSSLRLKIVSCELRKPTNVPILKGPYGVWHRWLMEVFPEGEKEGVSFLCLEGDARKNLKSLSFKADAVFLDPFSPYVNPELWTLEFLSILKNLIKEEGYLTTYSKALPFRKALLDLGFKIGETSPVGRRGGGTVASLKGPVIPLSQKERRRLSSSPYAVPMRDPSLRGTSLEILIRYFEEVHR